MSAAVYIAIVGEDKAHYEVAWGLYCRVFTVDANHPSPRYWTFSELKRKADELRTNKYGHFDDSKKTHPDAAMWRRAFMTLKVEHPNLGLVIAVRDDDRQGREQGLDQAIEDPRRPPFKVVKALAFPEVEVWFIAGFEPDGKAEQARLKAQQKLIGFDPRFEGDRLGAKGDRDPKKVLAALVGGDADRTLRCLEIAIDVLKDRGRRTGLTDYLEALEELATKRGLSAR